MKTLPATFLACVSGSLTQPQPCVQQEHITEETYMCLLFAYQSIAQSKYLLVEQEGRCISTVSQTHKLPHTTLIATANGLVRVMAMVPGAVQSKNRSTLKAKIEPTVLFSGIGPVISLREIQLSMQGSLQPCSQGLTTQHQPSSVAKRGPPPSGKELPLSKEVKHALRRRTPFVSISVQP